MAWMISLSTAFVALVTTTSRIEATSLTIEIDSVHCIQCDDLEHALRLDDDQLEHYRDEDDATMCCVESPLQLLKLVDSMADRRPGLSATAESMGMHAVLSLRQGLPPRHSYYSEILPSEWSFDSDVAFCEATRHFCDSFNADTGRIVVPFDGNYNIHCNVAWRGKQHSSHSTNAEYRLRVHRITDHRPEAELLAEDLDFNVRPNDCDDPRRPCAYASVDFPATLRAGDEIYVNVTFKELLMEFDHLSFLEISGRRGQRRSLTM
ncbi:hypothetical protein CAPTEDRAFT_191434 [Capitella teleta]|uniref:THD domain-containing protein n=1 Tax=Capitella teleta TaxID=283909 RepID=R7VAB4_CAPTE|nr:hypothetical protein CAPTEDRAFT_191434 [Capitella teleta]|eukprot:ELU15758.1 hypothetical protein CAPTEDRAFT_191434 [Capitella teleta]